MINFVNLTPKFDNIEKKYYFLINIFDFPNTIF
jgi:murein L,D-transpeptidase YafK